MPKLLKQSSNQKENLYHKGVARVEKFCKVNKISLPIIEAIPIEDWHVGACAYYHRDTIKICLTECASPATELQTRNWNWPGSTTDREPYGVLCHELGHHCDFYSGMDCKGHSYSSLYCQAVMAESGEEPITSYCPNTAEWFSEIFRLFITNHALLVLLRPVAHSILSRKFEPVSNKNWIVELGQDVPLRIKNNLYKKIANA